MKKFEFILKVVFEKTPYFFEFLLYVESLLEKTTSKLGLFLRPCVDPEFLAIMCIPLKRRNLFLFLKNYFKNGLESLFTFVLF